MQLFSQKTNIFKVKLCLFISLFLLLSLTDDSLAQLRQVGNDCASLASIPPNEIHRYEPTGMLRLIRRGCPRPESWRKATNHELIAGGGANAFGFAARCPAHLDCLGYRAKGACKDLSRTKAGGLSDDGAIDACETGGGSPFFSINIPMPNIPDLTSREVDCMVNLTDSLTSVSGDIDFSNGGVCAKGTLRTAAVGTCGADSSNGSVCVTQGDSASTADEPTGRIEVPFSRTTEPKYILLQGINQFNYINNSYFRRTGVYLPNGGTVSFEGETHELAANSFVTMDGRGRVFWGPDGNNGGAAGNNNTVNDPLTPTQTTGFNSIGVTNTQDMDSLSNAGISLSSLQTIINSPAMSSIQGLTSSGFPSTAFTNIFGLSQIANLPNVDVLANLASQGMNFGVLSSLPSNLAATDISSANLNSNGFSPAQINAINGLVAAGFTQSQIVTLIIPNASDINAAFAGIAQNDFSGLVDSLNNQSVLTNLGNLSGLSDIVPIAQIPTIVNLLGGATNTSTGTVPAGGVAPLSSSTISAIGNSSAADLTAAATATGLSNNSGNGYCRNSDANGNCYFAPERNQSVAVVPTGGLIQVDDTIFAGETLNRRTTYASYIPSNNVDTEDTRSGVSNYDPRVNTVNTPTTTGVGPQRCIDEDIADLAGLSPVQDTCVGSQRVGLNGDAISANLDPTIGNCNPATSLFCEQRINENYNNNAPAAAQQE
jgi:hypothetical protein